MRFCMLDFYKGVDISSLPESLAEGMKTFDRDGREMEPFALLKKYGVNAIRLRIWNQPELVPEAKGYCSLDHTLQMARKITENGMSFLLDFHYSDFWADPGHQKKPTAWEKLDREQLKEAVYTYTRDTLLALEAQQTLPDMVQIGNEIRSGLLFPEGELPDYEGMVELINAGIRGARAVAGPDRMQIMIHLDQGGRYEWLHKWFEGAFERGLMDFDIIGLSYYPFWHGTYLDLQHSMEKLIADYGKPIILAETAYAWRQSEKGFIDARQIEIGGLPASPEGQLRELETVMHLTAALPDKLGRGIYYWEPLCVPKAEHGGWSENMGLLDEKGCAMQGFLAYLQTREEMERVPAGFEELMEKVRNTVSEAGSYSGENKVKNGDFLEFTSDWEITGSETAKLTFEEGEPGCTSRILRLESPKKFRFCMKQKINLAPGETYRLSVEAKGVDTTGVEVCLFAGAPEENTEEEQRVMIHPTENWKQYSLTGKAGEDGQMVLGIRVDSPAIYLCIRQIWLT